MHYLVLIKFTKRKQQGRIEYNISKQEKRPILNPYLNYLLSSLLLK